MFGSGIGHFWGRFSHCAPVQRPLMRHTFFSTHFSSTVNCRHVLFVVVCRDWMLRFLTALMPTGVVSIVFRLAMFSSKRIRDCKVNCSRMGVVVFSACRHSCPQQCLCTAVSAQPFLRSRFCAAVYAQPFLRSRVCAAASAHMISCNAGCDLQIC